MLWFVLIKPDQENYGVYEIKITGRTADPHYSDVGRETAKCWSKFYRRLKHPQAS